jgi:hypothetical protein
MPKNYKILGQAAPAATTNVDVYTVPANTQAVISTIVIANRTASDATYRIALRPGGATLANEHYIAYDVTVGLSDSTTMTLGITLSAGDVVTIYSSSPNVSFNLLGSEITD